MHTALETDIDIATEKTEVYYIWKSGLEYKIRKTEIKGLEKLATAVDFIDYGVGTMNIDTFLDLINAECEIKKRIAIDVQTLKNEIYEIQKRNILYDN